MRVRSIYATATAAAAACAEAMRALIEESVALRGVARVAVSGGSTPRLMFDALSGMALDWGRIDWFWVDERCVPPDHELSNYAMTARHLLAPAGVAAERVHRVRGELAPEEAAAAYIEEMERVFEGEFPEFDVVQLGLGADAHTASLFPGEPLIEEIGGVAAAVYVEKLDQWRVTLLPEVLFAARARLVLATGADKAEALRRITSEPLEPRRLPAQLLLSPDAISHFFLDQAAAGLE
jgi:6-phosphogluconolactonase